MRGLAGAALALLAGVPVSPAASAESCQVAGEPVHWVADHCMAQLQTDDEIAAGDCIALTLAALRGADCDTKTWAKTQICRQAVVRGEYRLVEACVADAGFMGPTVRNRGVGR